MQYAPLGNALRSLRVDVEAVLQECESTAVECEGEDIGEGEIHFFPTPFRFRLRRSS